MRTETPSAVRIAREARGWSQERLARECELSRATIAEIEAGSLPRVETARRLAKALESTLDELFGEAA